MSFIKKIIKKSVFSLGYTVQKKSSINLGLTKACKLFEYDYGHLKSKELQKPVNKDGKPIPWFTYPAIDYLSQINFTDRVMLEWGSGNSSLFFSKRVKKLVSIEHNREWYELMKEHKIENFDLYFENTNYATKPNDFDLLFDIILIDGDKRKECAIESLKLINKGGLIILDNSDRYPDISKTFRDAGYIEVDFHGLGPINDYTWTTSLFFDRKINLIPISRQPIIPIGGGF